MNTHPDPLDILEKLRPASEVQRYWRETPPETNLPASSARPPRRRRLVLVTVVTAVLIATGAGIAGAEGLLPERFTRSLAFWASQGGVDVQNARRVAQGPGPDGTVLSVWSARSAEGTECIAPVYEAPGALDRPGPKEFGLVGGQCATPAQVQQQSFGDLGGSEDGHGLHTFWAAAGNAARAELRFPDGSSRPVLRADGRFYLWYVADARTATPTLVGFDAQGQVVGKVPLPNLGLPVGSDPYSGPAE